jgi:hypothetical protein
MPLRALCDILVGELGMPKLPERVAGGQLLAGVDSLTSSRPLSPRLLGVEQACSAKDYDEENDIYKL